MPVSYPAHGVDPWDVPLRAYIDDRSSDASAASYVNDTTPSATRTAITNLGDARWVKRGEQVINVADYGVVGDGTTLNNLSALNTRLTNGSGPLSVYWPPGSYKITAPLASVSFVRHFGPAFGDLTVGGPGTKLTWTTGNMLAPTTTLYGVEFVNLCLEGGGTSSHLIDLGTAGGLVMSRFSRCYINLAVASSSFLHQSNGAGNNLFDVDWDQCRIERLSTHTVPAFDIACQAGTNNLRVRGGWWHSHGCTSTPFFRAEKTSAGASMGAFMFESIIGEQNAGGMIHLGSVNAGARIVGVIDYDQSQLGAAYQDDLFKVYTAVTDAPMGVVIENCGTNIAGSFAAGKYHVNVAAGTRHRIGSILNGASDPLVNAPTVGRIQANNGAFVRSIRTVTAAYAANSSDDVLLCSSTTAFTVTLPAVASIPLGRTFTIKNQNTGTVTVAPAAGTIDGAANVTLAQWASVTVLSNGANWFTLDK